MSKIGFDLDGVLVDYLGGIVELARKKFPGRIPVNYVPKYDMEDVLTYPEWTDLVHDFYKAEDIWENLPPLQPNLDEFRTFVKSGRDTVYAITARPQTAGKPVITQTMAWFTKHNVPMHRENVIVCKASEKARFIRMLGIQFFTDDLYTTVDEVNELGPKHKAFLFDAPWNLHVPDMPRVSSIAHFIGTVRVLG